MINICLVGCGGMAGSYRHKYTQIPGARLVLLIDIDERTAESAARDLGVDRFSTNFQDALGDGIDIVDISTPNHLHAEQAIAALRAGKHVLLQKPIAPHIHEAESIVAAARASGMKAGIYMSMMENPVYHDIREMIHLGLFGTITSVHCRGAHKGGLEIGPESWRNSREKTGGGSFIQLASHHINMIQWLLDSSIVRVASFSKNLMCPNLEGDDSTTAICEFSSGILGTLESSYCAEASWLLSVYGSEGFISVTNDFRVELKLNQSFMGEAVRYAEPGRVETTNFDIHDEMFQRGSYLYDQHAAFVESVIEGKPVPVPLEAGLHDLKVVKAVYKAAEEQRFVNISEYDRP